MFDITPKVKILILVNVAVFALTSMNENLMSLFSLHNFNSESFYPFQMMTYMFLHLDFQHIIFNMLGLFFLGPLLERVWGAKRFLIFYFAVGIGVGVITTSYNAFEALRFKNDIASFQSAPTYENLYTIVNKWEPSYLSNLSENIENQNNIKSIGLEFLTNIEANKSQYIMLGASGAIFGIMMAFAMLFPNTEMMVMFIPFPIKAKYLVSILALYEMYKLLHKNTADHVSHSGHLLGILIGAAIVYYWRKDRKSFY